LKSGQLAHRYHLINPLNEWPQTKAISRTVPVTIAAHRGKHREPDCRFLGIS